MTLIKDGVKNKLEPPNVEFILTCNNAFSNEIHCYHPLSNYICSIPLKCFISGSESIPFENVLTISHDIATANSTNTLVLSEDITQINHFVLEKLEEKEPKRTVQKQLRVKKDWVIHVDNCS